MTHTQHPDCRHCGHSYATHHRTDGYKPYGYCNYQHDLCGCKNYEPALAPAVAGGPPDHAHTLEPPESIVRAIEIIKESRKTHLEWIEFLEKNPSPPDRRIAGGIAHHRKVVADYNYVISVLRRLA